MNISRLMTTTQDRKWKLMLVSAGGKAVTNLDSVFKSRDITFVHKCLYSQSYGLLCTGLRVGP